MKKTLSNYRYLFDEIKAWMIHREEILTMATKITASLNGIPSGSAESRKVETWAVKLAEVDDEIDKRVDMISKHLTSLTDYIYRLPPGNARNVLIYHYIDGLKFSEICLELRYSERQVYRLHRIGIEFLSKLAQDVSE